MFSPGNLGRGGMAVAPVLHPLVGGSTFNTWRLVNTGGEPGRANEAHRPMGVGAWRWEHYWGDHYPGLLHGWGYSRYYMYAMRNNSVVNRE